MKKIGTLMSVLASLCLVLSCSKKDDPVASSDVLINSKGWKITSQTVSPQIQGTSDYFSLTPDCVKDDILKFQSNGTYTEDEGATKCDASDPQTVDQGTWALSSDKKSLTITTDNQPEVITLTTLTATKIVGTNTQVRSGTTYTFTTTLTAL